MSRYFFRAFIVSVLVLFNMPDILSQPGGADRETIGGISKKQILLEKATIGVYYQFTYTIKSKDLAEKKTDTLFLASGVNQSVFLDRYYSERLEKDRKNRILRSKGVKFINNKYENLDEVIELINTRLDYKEDDPGDPGQIFKDRNKNTVTSIYNSYLYNIRCDQNEGGLPQWEIVAENDTIFGYLCQKAKINYSGRHYTAWFTDQIPINDGPWKFVGLPGLILKVVDDQDLFQWVAIGLENIDADIVMDEVKYENVNPTLFRDFVERETSTIIVSFYNNNVLYMTNKKRPYEKIPIEM